MPNFIQYSPWQDAAQYGQGLGHTLAQILFQVPQMRAEREMKMRQLALEERKVAAQEELYRQHGALWGAQAQTLPDKIAQMTEAAKALAAQRTANAELIKGKLAELHDLTQSLVNSRNAQAGKNNAIAAEVAPNAEANRNLKKAQTEYTNTKNDLAPDVANANIDKSLAGAALLRTRNDLAPQHEANYNAAVRTSAGLPIFEQMNQSAPAPLQPPPQQNSVMQSLGRIFGVAPAAPTPPPQVQPALTPSVIPSNPRVDALAPATVTQIAPPYPGAVRIRSKSTGQTGWAHPEAIQSNPDIEPIQ